MDLRKYIYSHCVSPVKVRIWDSYSQSYVWREVPCGKCLHCKNTHINEWVTRLVAQKKFSKFTYYVSLDYAPFDEASPDSMLLAKETAACYHDINKNHSYGLHPLVLCKNHLQDFYKRLRKNTGLKIQYFACGEYGTHADGHGYGRPHFHNIIFSNEPISPAEFHNAWSINGYKIGRVDLTDLSFSELGSVDNLKIFKYVCKYLQKSDFDFDKLATIDFHRAYFKALHMVCVSYGDLFSSEQKVFGLSSSEVESAWREYIKQYSPFIVCSRRPSIGSAYLEENLERFKSKDFRLFGLPNICTIFPRYYARRAKESAFPFQCLGKESLSPSSSARMGYVLQVLAKLQYSEISVDNWTKTSSYTRCCYRDIISGKKYLRLPQFGESVELSSLSFYDMKNKFLYQFNGYMYNVWAKLKGGTYALFDQMAVSDVLQNLTPSWDSYFNVHIRPVHTQRILQESDFLNSIRCMYTPKNGNSSYDLFLDEVHARYQEELDTIYKTKKLMINSKQNL